jgi:hypothetical protein
LFESEASDGWLNTTGLINKELNEFLSKLTGLPTTFNFPLKGTLGVITFTEPAIIVVLLEKNLSVVNFII